MSLVYITYHNENIYDWEKQYRPVTIKKIPRHKSMHSSRVREDLQKLHIMDLPDGKKLLTESTKDKHKTMGYAETPLAPPCAFLKKKQGIQWRREKSHICLKGGNMPPVPRFERPERRSKPEPKKKKENVVDTHCPHMQPFTEHKHRANFIAVNIERCKTAPTKHPPPRYVDTPQGTTHNLLNSGYLPQYICGRNFGKVPCYIRAHKKMLKKEKQRCMEEKKQRVEKCHKYVQPGVRPMTAEERNEILTGLKTNLAELNKVYQKLPLYTDTIAKALRKGKMENDLRQLEQDIYLMESNPVIYIADY